MVCLVQVLSSPLVIMTLHFWMGLPRDITAIQVHRDHLCVGGTERGRVWTALHNTLHANAGFSKNFQVAVVMCSAVNHITYSGPEGGDNTNSRKTPDATLLPESHTHNSDIMNIPS